MVTVGETGRGFRVRPKGRGAGPAAGPPVCDGQAHAGFLEAEGHPEPSLGVWLDWYRENQKFRGQQS